MSSNGYALPLRLDINTSRQLRLSIIFAHVWAIFIVFGLYPESSYSASNYIVTLFLVLVLVSLCYYLYRYRAGGTHMPSSILLRDLGIVRVKFLTSAEDCQDSRSQRAEIRGDSYLHPWLVILNLKFTDGKRLSIPLPRDSLNHNQHRQLRVYLRLQQYRLTLEK